MTARTAVVTGASSGIGEALVRLLLERGMFVVGVGRDEAKLRSSGSFEAVICDLSDPMARSEAAGAIAKKHTRIDVLVNNAGITAYETPTSYPLDRWQSLLEVNLLAAVELSSRLSPCMPPGSSLVNVSSVVTRHMPNAKFAPYAISKSALDRLTEALRLELDPRGIRVSLMAPGLVDTPIYDKSEGFAKTKAKIREQIPTWLSAQDVAEAIVWMIERPAHVVVSEIVLLPQGQVR